MHLNLALEPEILFLKVKKKTKTETSISEVPFRVVGILFVPLDSGSGARFKCDPSEFFVILLVWSLWWGRILGTLVAPES